MYNNLYVYKLHPGTKKLANVSASQSYLYLSLSGLGCTLPFTDTRTWSPLNTANTNLCD